ncbi:uncharacterized protein AMSG_09200 [Thecamonas trahens ATCC 50062]|uniref:ENTH domain-containing protein n=1 Tax=Thecamonas trahens ATCC 50062 TaxID=461836 RepID=A0A0L0DKY8_THETB|nr:hypothetical protein AMSG_09200 [Thecamonas trahens ATCC 50062]KNC53019.1 hypothetical protein AMSG_09200 [Thecamonas trahens ATCC 50062]|eukprot:XP_013754905.1 hypothetical protein AMSG_09200 [Thecamonas trahens ATCC 50062]
MEGLPGAALAEGEVVSPPGLEKSLATAARKAAAATKTFPKRKHVRRLILASYEAASGLSIVWHILKARKMKESVGVAAKSLAVIHTLSIEGHPQVSLDIFALNDLLIDIQAFFKAQIASPYGPYCELVVEHAAFVRDKAIFMNRFPIFVGFKAADELRRAHVESFPARYQAYVVAGLMDLLDHTVRMQTLLFAAPAPGEAIPEPFMAFAEPTIHDAFVFFSYAKAFMVHLVSTSRPQPDELADVVAYLSERFFALYTSLRSFFYDMSTLKPLAAIVDIPVLGADMPILALPDYDARALATSSAATPPTTPGAAPPANDPLWHHVVTNYGGKSKSNPTTPTSSAKKKKKAKKSDWLFSMPEDAVSRPPLPLPSPTATPTATPAAAPAATVVAPPADTLSSSRSTPLLDLEALDWAAVTDVTAEAAPAPVVNSKPSEAPQPSTPGDTAAAAFDWVSQALPTLETSLVRVESAPVAAPPATATSPAAAAAPGAQPEGAPDSDSLEAVHAQLVQSTALLESSEERARFEQRELVSAILAGMRENIDAAAASLPLLSSARPGLDAVLSALREASGALRALASLDSHLPYPEYAATQLQRSVTLSRALTDLMGATKTALAMADNAGGPEASRALAAVRAFAIVAAGGLDGADGALATLEKSAALENAAHVALDAALARGEQVPAVAPDAAPDSGSALALATESESEWELETSSSDSDEEIDDLLVAWPGGATQPGRPSSFGDELAEVAAQVQAIVDRLQASVAALEARGRASGDAPDAPVFAASMDIAQGIAALVSAATEVQKQVAEAEAEAEPTGASSTNPFAKPSRSSAAQRRYVENQMYCEGLISAARHCGSATEALVEACEEVVAGSGSVHAAEARAKLVKSSICQILAASRAKTEPGSELHASLGRASSAVDGAVAGLLVALRAAVAARGPGTPEAQAGPPTSLTRARIQEMELQTKILQLEDELSKTRAQLGALRRAQYAAAASGDA